VNNAFASEIIPGDVIGTFRGLSLGVAAEGFICEVDDDGIVSSYSIECIEFLLFFPSGVIEKYNFETDQFAPRL